MRLTRYTDYALRVLLYLGARPDTVCSIAEIAGAYGISKNHLMKVVQDLGTAGYVVGVRGRLGGIRLARLPAEINVGSVVRHTEGHIELAECGSCLIAPACGLTGVLGEALAAFLAVLDRHTLEGLLAQRDALRALLGIVPPTAAPSPSSR